MQASEDEERRLPAEGGDESAAQRRKDELAHEPAAVAMPKAQERFSGGTRRPKAAMTMPKDEAAMPMPTSMPPLKYSMAGLAAPAMRAVPTA